MNLIGSGTEIYPHAFLEGGLKVYRDETDFEKKRHTACLINARCSRRFTYHYLCFCFLLHDTV